MSLLKLFGDAQVTINRVVQASNEAFGLSEKTEFDEEFMSLLNHAQTTHDISKSIISSIECWVNPNPARKIEDIGEQIESLVSSQRSYHLKVPAKLPSEYLGETFLSASVDVGRRPEYGQALKKCGEYQRKIAQHEVERNDVIERVYIKELFNFLQNDWTGLQREMKKLEEARLDFDKSRNKLTKTTESNVQLESQTDKLRVLYEQQLELTRFKLKQMNSSYISHLLGLKEFVVAQGNYFTYCKAHSEELLTNLDKLIADDGTQ